jgi:CRP-like cAMP-binding protein
MDNIQTQLAEHPFLRDLPAAHLREVAACARPASFAEDTYIFRAHEYADRFYLLHRGSAALRIHVPHLGPVPIQTIKSGEALGWSWLLPPYRWHFDARVIEPVEASAIDARMLRHLMDQQPELGYQMLKRVVEIMALRLQATRLQLLDVYETRAS